MLLSRLLRDILASTLLLVLSTAVSAQTFYFNGYGGFSDPGEITPTTPADGADDDSSVGFLTPYDFTNQSTFDTDLTAWGTFEWFLILADHSHLSINELTPASPPGMSTFASPHTGPMAVGSPGEVVGWLIHHNEVLKGGTPFGPDNIAIHYHLDIYADIAKTQLLWSSGPMDFTVDMMETLNTGMAGVCLDNNGGTTGADTGFSPPCPDRFRFAEGWPNNPTGGDAFERVLGTFTYRGERYSVAMSGFWDGDTLIGEAWSAENTHNQFDIRAHIISLPNTAIPTLPPIALVLVGLLMGLLGFRALKQKRFS